MSSKPLSLVDTVLKACSKCSCITYTLRFFADFRLVSSSLINFENTFKILLTFLLSTSVCQAGEVRHSEVTHQHGIYTLKLDMLINARIDRVQAIATDYDGMSRLSKVIIESNLLENSPNNKLQRRLLSRSCILIFCFNVIVVEEVEETDNAIITTILPEQSDFKSGNSRWQIASVNGEQSELSFRYELEPDFWIPPLIGPLVMKRRLLKEAKEIITNIEMLSREEAVH